MTPEGVSADPVAEARAAFLQAADAGDAHAAGRAGRRLLALDPGPRQRRLIRKTAEAARDWRPAPKPWTVALLSSFSLEFIHDALVARGFLDGLAIRPHQGGFNTFRQDILDPDGWLYRLAPDAVVLAIDGRDLVPAFYDGYLSHKAADPAGFETVLAAAVEELQRLLATLRSRSSTPILVHGFVPPTDRLLGILDGLAGPQGQGQLVERLNAGLYAVTRDMTGVFPLDLAAVAARLGAGAWQDERMRHYAGLPVSAAMLDAMAREHVTVLRGLSGLAKKCLVVDLDNTLWGGILGEDGLDGIALGPTYPGNAFRAFQERLLALRQRGILLAVASKNNPADVDEAFARHPHMRLKPDHISSWRVGWMPKSQGLQEIAAELGIGLEHVVLADDNPAEIAEVEAALPMVRTVHLPASRPEAYAGLVVADGLFDTISLSAEDLQRGDLYRQRAEAEKLRAGSGSLEEYWRSLEMTLTLAPVTPATLPRTAQLTQKTNQFNATTIRRSEAEVAALAADPRWHVETLSVTDRFGDNGLVGVVLAGPSPEAPEETLEIDTILLSCRVIGRTVETALLASVCEAARARGYRRLNGRIRPTAKNIPVRDLYQRHGFEPDGADAAGGAGEEGETLWRLDLTRQTIAVPPWLRVVHAGPSDAA